MREERDEPVWYVLAQGRAWGPYTEARMAAFVDEGRVAQDSLISDDLDGPFLPAGETEGLSRLFRAEPAPKGAYSPPTSGGRLGAGWLEPAVEHAGAPRPLLIFANLGALDEATFESALGIHGPFERVGRGLWLARVRLGAAALRNALSRRMRGADTLLVVEAGLDQVAWFNLDQAEERKLRALWLG